MRSQSIIESSHLRVFKTLYEAWSLVKGSKGAIWLAKLATLGIVIGVGVAIFVISLLIGLIFAFSEKNGAHLPPAFGMVINIISYLVFLFLVSPLAAGILMVGVKRARGEPVSLSTPFNYWKKWWSLGRVILYSTLAFIIILLPFIFITIFLTTLSHVTSTTIDTNSSTAVLSQISANVDVGGALLLMLCFALTFVVMTYLVFLVLFSILRVVDAGITPLRAVGHAFSLLWQHVFRIIGLGLMLTLIGLIVALPFIIGIILHSFIIVFFAVLFYIGCYIWLMPYFYIVYSAAYTKLASEFDHKR